MSSPSTLVLSSPPPPLRGTAGRPVHAIGDVHGRLDLLDALAEILRADARNSGTGEPPLWIFLGDYVDRGPSSPAVLDRLIDWTAQGEPECLCLCGNHEYAVIKFLANWTFGPRWMAWGGGATLAAYGIEPPAPDDADGWRWARDAFNSALPDRHCDFLLNMPFSHEVGDYFFAHAGARAGVDLDDQEPDDLTMIRDGFLERPGGFDRVIVHGHTPQDVASHEGWRIGVDTGAYATGILSAVRILDFDVRFLQTGGGKGAQPSGSGLRRKRNRLRETPGLQPFF